MGTSINVPDGTRKTHLLEMANHLKADITPESQATLLAHIEKMRPQTALLGPTDRDIYRRQLEILAKFIEEDPESRASIQSVVGRLLRQEIFWEQKKDKVAA